MSLTIAHGGDLEYIAEATFDAGFPASGSLLVPSDSITSIELAFVSNVERHKTVSDHVAIDTSYHSREVSLTVEYKLQQRDATGTYDFDKSLEYYGLYRSSHDLSSLCFLYSTNGTHYRVKGAKVNSLSFTCNVDESITVSAEIWGTGGTAETSAATFTNYSSLTPAAAIGNSFEVYGGSAITKSGKFANGIKSGTFTFNNGLERIPHVGSQDTYWIAPGGLDISMTLDILTDAGGKTDVDDLLSGDETDIVFDTGTTADKSQKFTFTNPSFNRTPVIYRADMTHMVISGDIGAEDVTHATYA